MRFVFFLSTATLTAGQFTTYIGDAFTYSVSRIATDAAGNTYVVGSRYLSPQGLSGPTDAFLTKVDPTGKILFKKTLGGNASSSAGGIALDPSGNIYLAGFTNASDFPLSHALQTKPSPLGSAFIVKLSNDGATILYSTYFGGVKGPTAISAITTDAQGNLYLTGGTASQDFPVTPGLPTGSVHFPGPTATSGAIVAEISAAGDKIIYSGMVVGTRLGCTCCSSCFLANRYTSGVGIALDVAGNAYIAGDTNTLDLPTTAGVLDPHGVGPFVAKIAAGGGSLSYLTYLDTGQTVFDPFAGAPTTTVNAIAVDAAGNAYLSGRTNDPNFPTTKASLQPVLGIGPRPPFEVPFDAFFAKLNPTGTAFVWSSFLGGTGNDAAVSIALDAAQNVWATGTTTSPNFPNIQGTSQGGDFLVEADSAGTQLIYSARYPNGTVSQSVAVDPSGIVHLAGPNGIVSTIAPTAPPAIAIFGVQNAAGGNVGGQVSPAEVISIYGQQIGPAAPVVGAPVSGFYPKSLGGVQVTVNGINAPLLYVSSTQINAVVPMSVSGAGVVQVTYGSVIAAFPIQVVSLIPMAFTGVLNQDNTLNSADNPAKVGSVVYFYATGFQSNFPPYTDGQVATSAQDYCAGKCPVVDSSGATIVYGGAAPGIVAGVTQFNVKLPTGPFPIVYISPFGSLYLPALFIYTTP
jgi:uncharacterized protein (TIGR03437 family)